jgi:hypothetical protein
METQTIRPETVSRRRLAVVAALVVLALAAGPRSSSSAPRPIPARR